jgi:hypothetical protein
MDWYVLLTPLLLLPIVSLLVFVGCGLDDEGGFKGVPVTIYCNYPPDLVAGHAWRLEFWCEYNDSSGDKRSPPNEDKRKVDDFSSPQTVSLKLPGDYYSIPTTYYCNCKCDVWRIDHLEGDPIFSGPVPFEGQDKLYFELKVFPAETAIDQQFRIWQTERKT